MGLGSGIRDPGSGKNLFWIPDPGVKKAPDPGSATLNFPKLVSSQVASGLNLAQKWVNQKDSGIWIRSTGYLGALDAGPDAKALRVGDLARRLVVRDHAEQPRQNNQRLPDNHALTLEKNMGTGEYYLGEKFSLLHIGTFLKLCPESRKSYIKFKIIFLSMLSVIKKTNVWQP
jgi:hypothetical protein